MLNCKNCLKDFIITDVDREFYNKMGVPEPTWCPECRRKRRLIWRNEKNLYPRKCDFSGKDILAVYPADSEYKVYDAEAWYGDAWEAADYARDYDPSRPFFEQFSELQKSVPRPARAVIKNVNSGYVNQAWNSKDCYMCFDAGFSENIMYCAAVYHSKDLLDSSFTRSSEMSFNLIDSQNCFNCRYLQDCSDCHDVYFSFDCKGCSNVAFCSNLRNQTNYLFNKPVSQKEFEDFVAKISLGSYAQYVDYVKRWREETIALAIHKYAHNIKTINCSGDYLLNSKNCLECFDVDASEDLKYCNRMDERVYNSMDLDYCAVCELVYESSIVTGNNIRFCLNSHSTSVDCWYCDFTLNCKNCFGCAGLKNKEFCILNKKYSEKDYYEQREKIVEKMKRDGEWGEFFSMNFSPFAYNETVAIEYFPLTKEQVLKLGYRWKDNLPGTFGQETVKPDNLPDKIGEVKDEILKEILVCVNCQKNYKIIAQELKFYRQNSLPLPRQCFKCRNVERISFRNPQKLYDRPCSNCQKEIRTTYAPDRPEKVYCEECYQKAIY